MKRRYILPYVFYRTGVWIGLFAMVLQNLAGTSHAGAMAAAVTGNLQPLSGAFGLLQICTPLGIIEINPAQSVPSQQRSFEPQCPLCAAPALCSYTFARVVHASLRMTNETLLIHLPPQSIHPRLVLGRKGLSRAPPV